MAEMGSLGDIAVHRYDVRFTLRADIGPRDL